MELNSQKKAPMKRILNKLSLATMVVALAGPAFAETYFFKCEGSNVDNRVYTTKVNADVNQTWELCGKRYYVSQAVVDQWERRCGANAAWILTTTGRTRICGGNGW